MKFRKHLLFFPQSLPASESFPMSQLFAWGGQSTGVSALASFLPKNIQGSSPLEGTGWISLFLMIPTLPSPLLSNTTPLWIAVPTLLYFWFPILTLHASLTFLPTSPTNPLTFLSTETVYHSCIHSAWQIVKYWMLNINNEQLLNNQPEHKTPKYIKCTKRTK